MSRDNIHRIKNKDISVESLGRKEESFVFLAHFLSKFYGFRDSQGGRIYEDS
jgi:hypothetical protein